MASKLFPMLSCTDLDRSLAFYGDLLGGVETYRFPKADEPAFVALRIGESSEIASACSRPVAARATPAPRLRSSDRALCLVDDVDEVYALAGSRGVETVAEPVDMPWGERVAWIADPDGNLVMLTG